MILNKVQVAKVLLEADADVNALDRVTFIATGCNSLCVPSLLHVLMDVLMYTVWKHPSTQGFLQKQQRNDRAPNCCWSRCNCQEHSNNPYLYLAVADCAGLCQDGIIAFADTDVRADIKIHRNMMKLVQPNARKALESSAGAA